MSRPGPLVWIAIALTIAAGAAVIRGSAGSTLPRYEVAPVTVPADQKPSFNREIINPGQGLPMVHVASLAAGADGMLSAVWYGGTRECADDVRIYFAQRESGSEWTAPRAVMTRGQAEQDLGRPLRSLGNAILLPGKEGELRLLFVTIAMGKWSGSQLNLSVSRDGGLTWSRAERLTLSPFFNFSELVRNAPLRLAGPLTNQLPSGGWCVPVYQEFLGKFPELLWLGEDEARDARKTRIAGGCTSFQPTVVPLDGSRAVALMRDYTDARRIFRSMGDDGGLAWSPPAPTDLPNPDAGISALRLSDGRLLLAYNNSTTARDNLSLALSGDEGRTWSRLVMLENEPAATFSYPYLMRDPSGLIHIAYTLRGQALALTSFNEAWIADQEATLAKSKSKAGNRTSP